MGVAKAIVIAALAAGSIAWSQAPSVAADEFPTAGMTIVVPFPAGGTADTLPRIVAEILREKWKQPVTIENRSGAGGNIGAEYVAHAMPDGYTLLAAPPGPLVINQSLYKTLKYDANKFVPITIFGAVPNVLAVGPHMKVGSVRALIDDAKANPSKITYASQGLGSTSHLTASLFEIKAGVKLVHVPYKGSAPALNDLMGGHVDLMFDNLGSSLALHRAGKLKILAVAAASRAAMLPDIPTVAEAGLPDFQSVTWFGMVAPPNVPDAVAQKISHAVAEALRRDDVRKQYRDMAVEPIGGTPQETAAFFAQERARWSEVIKAANLKLD